jgi:Na+/H+ antiporter NhaC
VLGGAVFGDQCSPISDTTILASMFTGCDLMHHVRTQLPLALAAAGLGAALSVLSALLLT